MTNRTDIGNHRIEQIDCRVVVSSLINGRYVGTDLQKTWFGYALGFERPFEDEESANFAYRAVVEHLQGVEPFTYTD